MSLSTVLLLLSGLIGTGICYFALAAQREIAATSFMVLQNVVRMAVVVVGVIVFHDPIRWPYQVLGLILSFAGALWYGKSSLGIAEDHKAQQEAVKAPNSPSPTAVREAGKAQR